MPFCLGEFLSIGIRGWGLQPLQSVFSWAEFCFKKLQACIGDVFLLFYTSCTMLGNFYPPVRQYYFSMLGVAFQKTYSTHISWRSMPAMLVKIHEFLCCCLIVLALRLPLSLFNFFCLVCSFLSERLNDSSKEIPSKTS